MRLHVSFASPGFFLNDPRVVVTLGDRTLYDGSFREGFSVSVEIPPGDHVLETAIHVAGTPARQRFELPLGDTGSYRGAAIVEAKLAYSRLTGNFDKRFSLSIRG